MGGAEWVGWSSLVGRAWPISPQSRGCDCGGFNDEIGGRGVYSLDWKGISREKKNYIKEHQMMIDRSSMDMHDAQISWSIGQVYLVVHVRTMIANTEDNVLDWYLIYSLSLLCLRPDLLIVSWLVASQASRAVQ